MCDSTVLLLSRPLLWPSPPPAGAPAELPAEPAGGSVRRLRGRAGRSRPAPAAEAGAIWARGSVPPRLAGGTARPGSARDQSGTEESRGQGEEREGCASVITYLCVFGVYHAYL